MNIPPPKPGQDPKIEEQMREGLYKEKNSDGFDGVSLLLGLFIASICLVGAWVTFNVCEYRNIEDVEGDKLLILCDDDSTEWFNLPKCKGPDNAPPKCEEKISSHCPKCRNDDEPINSEWKYRDCSDCKRYSLSAEWRCQECKYSHPPLNRACNLIKHGIPDMFAVAQINAKDYLVDYCGLTSTEVDDLIADR